MRPNTLPNVLLGVAGLLLGGIQPAASVLVYVSSYAGTITTLNVTLPEKGGGGDQKASIDIVSTDQNCGPNTSWLTLDKAEGVLYCLDENFNGPNGTLVAYKTSETGKLEYLNKTLTPGGPVYASLYGEKQRGLAVAEYGGSAFSTYLKDPSSFAQIQHQFFRLNQPGANATRQTAPHPHEVILDPTGDFFVVPDLGADLVRIFRIDQSSLGWEEVDPLATAPGAGPRHVAFSVQKGGKTKRGEKEKKYEKDEKDVSATYMYLVNELINTVTTYSVTYAENKTLQFAEIDSTTTVGGDPVPEAASGAEIAVVGSDGDQFVLVSSRNDQLSKNTLSGNGNGVSDTLTTFRIDAATGKLAMTQRFPAGGLVPRHFSVNHDGTLVGVGLQGSEQAVFLCRDVESGNLTSFAGAVQITGEVTSVVFDE